MSLELTDQKRYEMEKENIVNLVLAAQRQGTPLTEADLQATLGIGTPTLQKLLAALKTENIIK